MSCISILAQLSKISFCLAFTLTVACFILGWIGFGVPDWLGLSFQNTDPGSTILTENKFGLWYYCAQSITVGSTFTCTSWQKSMFTTPGKWATN